MIESYDVVEFTTRRGVPIRGRCLTVRGTARILRLLEATQKGAEGAQAELLDLLDELTGIGDPPISLAETLDEVLPHFLNLSGPQTQAVSPAAPTLDTSTSAGTI